MTRDRHLILVKHAMPQVDVEAPAHQWRLRPEGAAAAGTLALRLLARYQPSKVIASVEPKATETVPPTPPVRRTVTLPTPAVGLKVKVDPATCSAPGYVSGVGY